MPLVHRQLGRRLSLKLCDHSRTASRSFHFVERHFWHENQVFWLCISGQFPLGEIDEPPRTAVAFLLTENVDRAVFDVRRNSRSTQNVSVGRGLPPFSILVVRDDVFSTTSGSSSADSRRALQLSASMHAGATSERESSFAGSTDAAPKATAALAMGLKVLPPDHFDITSYQTTLGSVLIDLHRFSEAQRLLTEAQSTLDAKPFAPARLKKRHIESLVRLYDAWHADEPGKGYDQKAAQWRAKLRAWQATTQPAV